MEKFILKLREKPENERKKILVISLIISMVIIGGIWIYSVTHSFTQKDEKVTIEEKKGNKKPFQLLGFRFKDTYENILANVNKAKIMTDDNIENISNDKVIDLIPVNKE